MFGYLAFVSLALSICAIGFVILATPLRVATNGTSVVPLVDFFSAFVIAGVSIVIAHMFVTTTYGLYYLIDRLYDSEPVIAERKPDDDGASG